jgi:hypothetical protein
MANGLKWEVQERGETRSPLVHEMLAVNDNERIHLLLGDEPGSHGGFSKRGRSTDYAVVGG